MPITGPGRVMRNVITLTKKEDGRLLVDNKTISIRDQIDSINGAVELNQLSDVSVVDLRDGSMIIYNANTAKYEVKPVDCGEYT